MTHRSPIFNFALFEIRLATGWWSEWVNMWVNMSGWRPRRSATWSLAYNMQGGGRGGGGAALGKDQISEKQKTWSFANQVWRVNEHRRDCQKSCKLWGWHSKYEEQWKTEAESTIDYKEKTYCVNIILIPHFVHGKKQDEDDINSSKRPICKWDIYVRGSTQVVIRSRKGARAEICAAPRNYFGQMYCLPQNHCTQEKYLWQFLFKLMWKTKLWRGAMQSCWLKTEFIGDFSAQHRN